MTIGSFIFLIITLIRYVEAPFIVDFSPVVAPAKAPTPPNNNPPTNPLPIILPVEDVVLAQSETLGDCVKILIFAS